ncbi:laminin B domain-containing protein [Fibrella arboris]|uniref:laminin B domain-containing protein n=1 Tax=Fibrella arboris TaxID=3242486 RepID=UPI003521F06B
MLKRQSKDSKKLIVWICSLIPLFTIGCQDFSTFIRLRPYLANFDKDSQGWKVSTGAKGGYSPKEGNPSGYIYGIDSSTDTWYFLASDSLVYESKKGYGKTLSFELEQSATDSQGITSDDVVLSDGIITLTYNTSYNPAMTWTSYSVKLDELSGWKNGNKAVTKDEFRHVLDHLSGLKIRGEFRAGPDRGGLDNVSLK